MSLPLYHLYLMRNLLLMVLLIALVDSQKPNCRVPAIKQVDTLYLMPQELQSYELASYFQGFNLNYKVTGPKDAYRLIEPFYQNDIQPITLQPNKDYDVVDLDMETDSSLAWMGRASSLGRSSDGTYFVQYGSLNDQQNIVFNNKVTLNISGVQCFNVITAPKGLIVVDCQYMSIEKDILFVINEADQSVANYTFDNAPLTTERKTALLQLNTTMTFLVSACTGKGMKDRTLENQTYFTIYQLTEGVLKIVLVVDAEALGLLTMSISDITIDPLNNIFLSQTKGKVYQLGFDGQNITTVKDWRPTDGKIYKISVGVTSDLVTTVNVVGETNIYEFNATAGQQYVVRTYSLPGNITQVRDFQTSNDLLIVHTTNFYYVYRRFVRSADQLLAAILSENSKFAASPRTPNVVFLSQSYSVAYLLSQGFFVAINSKVGLDTQVLVNATSTAFDGSIPVTCSVKFHLTTVTDLTKIYVKGDPSRVQTSESLTVITSYLDDYFVGSNLNFFPQPGHGVKMTLLHNESAIIVSDDSSLDADWLATFSYDIGKYYKITVGRGSIVVQNCQYQGEDIQCKVGRKTDFSQRILHHAFLKSTIDTKSRLPIMAYVTESDQRKVNIIQLDSDRSFDSITVSQIFNITDIDANSAFIYVTIKDSKQIRAYRNDLGNLTLQTTIDSGDFPADFTFYPKLTILSPADINLIFVKSVDSIIILKNTAFQTKYISSISIPSLALISTSYEIVVGKYNILVFISTNDTSTEDQVIEYGIYDIYNPVEMKRLSLLDKQIVRPVSVYTVENADMVAVKTQDIKNGTYLSVFKTGFPQVGSLFTEIQVGDSVALSLVGLGDSAVLEASPQTNLPEAYILQSQRLFYNPMLLIMAEVKVESFKQTLSYGLTVTGILDNYNYNTKVNFYNIRSQITKSDVKQDPVKFPKNSNADQIQIVLDADKLFVGPVASYSIDCAQCGELIQLKDHTIFLTTGDNIVNTVGFHHFADKERIWMVNNTGVFITDTNLSVKSSLPFPWDPLATSVLNWGLSGVNTFIVLLANSTDGSQCFVTISADEGRQTGVISNTWQITNGVSVLSAQLIKVFGANIFVLDNTLDGSGRGVIHVFSIGVNYTINFQSKIDYTTFLSPSQEKINDFEIVGTTDYNVGFLIVTFGKIGLAHFTFDSYQSKFSPNNPSVSSLISSQIIAGNQANGSLFLQIQIYSNEVTDTTIEMSALMTFSNGNHLKANLNFVKSDTGFVVNSIQVTSSYAKYGLNKVINWASTLPYQDHSQNILIVGYVGIQAGKRCSFGLYKLQNESLTTVQMKGAVETPVSDDLSGNIAALLFRDQTELKLVISASNSGQGVAEIYRLNSTVSLTSRYDKLGVNMSIILKAENTFGQAQRDITVMFDNGGDKPHGLAWYIILVIVLGCLMILGVVVFLVIRYKRKAAVGKQSLLSASKQESDEDI